MAEGVSERPTMAEAFASDISGAASLPADPSPETPPAASASADATVPPAEATSADTPTETPKGEPPKERWDSILANARTKAKDEALAEWRQQHGWAESVDRGAVQEAARIGQLFQQDRVGFLRQVLAEAVADQTLAPMVRSEAARVLGMRAQPTVDLSPDVPVINANGQEVTRTYSAERVQGIVQQAIAEALAKEVGPLKETVQSVAQERAHAAQLHQADQVAEQIYQQALTWPGFKEHEKAVGAEWDKHPDWSVQDAYIAVVVPKLQAAEKARTLDELKTKAQASTVNPAAAAVASPHKPTSLLDKSLVW